jgi:hypothetical protein
MLAIRRQQSDSVFLQPMTNTGAPTAVAGIPNQAEVRTVGWDMQADLLVTTASSILRFPADGKAQTTLLSMPAGRIF